MQQMSRVRENRAQFSVSVDKGVLQRFYDWLDQRNVQHIYEGVEFAFDYVARHDLEPPAGIVRKRRGVRDD